MGKPFNPKAPRSAQWMLAGALAGLMMCTPALANRYKLVDLGPNIYPRALNDRHEILAAKVLGNGDFEVVLSRDGHWRQFDKTDGSNVYAWALNQRGDIAGFGTDYIAGAWLNGTRFEPLGAPRGVYPSGISESRAVSGLYEDGDYSCFEMEWQGQLTTIEMPVPGSVCQPAQGISDASWVAGFFNIEQDNVFVAQRAFVWKGKGQAIDIGTLSHADLANAVAFGINGRGWVVGSSATDANTTRAYVWQNGKMRDIGESDQFPDYTVAAIVNNRGDIVGFGLDVQGAQHALRFDHGQVIDLDTEVENLGGLHIYLISGLNDQGEMTGSADLDGVNHGVVLIPD